MISFALSCLKQVPRATEKQGTSHYGGTTPDKMNVPLAQTGHEGYKISAPGQIVGQPGEKDRGGSTCPRPVHGCTPRPVPAEHL